MHNDCSDYNYVPHALRIEEFPLNPLSTRQSRRNDNLKDKCRDLTNLSSLGLAM